MEQERYRWLSPFDDKVLDDKTNNIINAIETLNQQDKKVKKLEQENQQLKQQLHDLPKNIMGEIRDVVAGGSVNCDNVGGNVTAKGSISMG